MANVRDPLPRLITWAAEQPDIRAVVLVGSLARQHPPADAYSDLDIILYTHAPQRYSTIEGWLAHLVTPYVHVPYPREDGCVEHMALFDLEQMLKIDLAFEPLHRLLNQIENGTLHEVLMRGYMPLLDKDDLLARLPAPQIIPTLPTAAEFEQTCTLFWYHAVRVAKQIKRGDLWYAYECDRALKDILLSMIGWYSVLQHPGVIPWHAGRFLHQWIEAKVYDALRTVFAGLNQADQYAALQATLPLFRHLAQTVAHHRALPYPVALDAAATRYIDQLWPS